MMRELICLSALLTIKLAGMICYQQKCSVELTINKAEDDILSI